MTFTPSELEEIRDWLIANNATDVTNLTQVDNITDKQITLPAVNKTNGTVVSVPLTAISAYIDALNTENGLSARKAQKAAAGAAKAMLDLEAAVSTAQGIEESAADVIDNINDAIMENLTPIAQSLYMSQVAQTSLSVVIEPNVLNVWGTVTALTVGFNTGLEGRLNEYMIQFTCPSNAPTMLTMPSSVVWIEEPEFEAGWTYQISVVNNLAVYAGWEPAVV